MAVLDLYASHLVMHYIPLFGYGTADNAMRGLDHIGWAFLLVLLTSIILHCLCRFHNRPMSQSLAVYDSRSLENIYINCFRTQHNGCATFK